MSPKEKRKEGPPVIKGCVIGCASFLFILLFTLAILLIWLNLPYRTFPIRAYFAKENVLAAQFDISMKNELIARSFTAIVRMMSHRRHNSLPLEKRKAAVESDMESIAHLKGLPAFDGTLLATAEGTKEEWIFFAPIPAQDKLCQILFDISTLFVPSRKLQRVNSAKIIVHKDKNSGLLKGFSIFKGHGLMGQVEPPIRLVTKRLKEGPLKNPPDSFISRYWPKKKHLVNLVIDNRKETLGRLLGSKGQKTDYFSGLVLKGNMVSLNVMEVQCNFHLRRHLDEESFANWLRDMTDTLLPAPFDIEIKKIVKEEKLYRTTLLVKGISTAVKQLEKTSEAG